MKNSLPAFFAAGLALGTASSVYAGEGAHWGYKGENGPFNWGGLATEFSTCKEGKSQSPIDISSVTVTQLDDIEINYQPSPLQIKNNGHTLQVDIADGSSITHEGKTYKLLQFHFHSPSEHTIGGKAYDMVAHMVHKSDDNELAVIGVMLEAGDENPVLKSIFDNAPKEPASKKVEGVTLNPQDLLPEDLTYFTYTGSLTTPPCSEGVKWIVLTAPKNVSKEQVAAFTGIFPESVRPVQPVNGRVVKLGN